MIRCHSRTRTARARRIPPPHLATFVVLVLLSSGAGSSSANGLSARASTGSGEATPVDSSDVVFVSLIESTYIRQLPHPIFFCRVILSEPFVLGPSNLFPIAIRWLVIGLLAALASTLMSAGLQLRERESARAKASMKLRSATACDASGTARPPS